MTPAVLVLALAAQASPSSRHMTAAKALRLLCGPSAAPLAIHVEVEARRYHVDAVLAVAVLRQEAGPGCRFDRVGTLGERGGYQILPGGSATRGYRHLPVEALAYPPLNAHLGIRHLRHLMNKCRKHRVTNALNFYSNNATRCSARVSDYSRAVLGWVHEAEQGAKT